MQRYPRPESEGGGVVVRELSGAEYAEQAHEPLVIAVQIETKAVLENVHEIAAVPGIDVLFIGPFDLGINIGHPISASGGMDAELVDAIQTIHEAAQAAGKKTEIYCDSGEQAREYAERGFCFI